MSRFSALIFILLCALGAVSCDGGDGAPPIATPSVTQGTPAPTATPTPPPPDPTLAEELRYEGDFEGAARVYGSIAAETAGEEQGAAQLAQAQMFVRAGLVAEARAPLEDHVAALGTGAAGSTGQFLLASTLDDLDEDVSATGMYETYVAADGVLASYARIELAKLYAGQGRVAEAEAAGLAVLEDPQVGELLGSFSLSMGRAYRGAGFNVEAQSWLGRVASYDGDVASAAYTLGEMKRELGDPTWADDYMAMIAAYPESAIAADMLAALDVEAVPVGPFLRGLVAYAAFDNANARTYLEEAVAGGDAPADASYYLGALAEREGDDAAAAEAYRRSVELGPDGALAASALWWRGRILEHDGQYDAALQAYTQLETDYPFSQRAGEAAFHRGLVLYRAGGSGRGGWCLGDHRREARQRGVSSAAVAGAGAAGSGRSAGGGRAAAAGGRSGGGGRLLLAAGGCAAWGRRGRARRRVDQRGAAGLGGDRDGGRRDDTAGEQQSPGTRRAGLGG